MLVVFFNVSYVLIFGTGKKLSRVTIFSMSKRRTGSLKVIFHPKSSEEQKKRSARPQSVKLSTQNRVKSKKKVITSTGRILIN